MEVPADTLLASIPGDSPVRLADTSDRVAAPPYRVSRTAMAVVTAFFVLIGHIWCIDTGLFLDDHAHFAHLRNESWSFHDAVYASRLGVVGEVMDMWNQDATGLHFFRPVSFWLMKIEYTLVRWSPMGMHAFSLGWHYLCSMLVGALMMRCLGDRLWATVAACLMAIHPAHMATVYWICCQTELMATAFLLMGILAYARYAGWGSPMFLPQKQTGDSTGSKWWAIPAIVCYGLALGSRENSLLFPVVCVAGDLLCIPPGRKRLHFVPVLMVAVLLVAVALRWYTMGSIPIPGEPYIVPFSHPQFIGWVIDKFAYYMIGLFGFVPVVPMGGQEFFRERVVMLYGSFAGTALILFVIWATYRFTRAMLWPLVWIVCLVAPLMPVFASSHHLYLPSVGMVVLATAGFAALGGIFHDFRRPLPRIQAGLCVLLLGLHAVGLTLLIWAYAFAYRTGTSMEDMVIDDVLVRGRPLHDGDYLFFINMPMLSYYTVPALQNMCGFQKLHGHVLTFSPQLLRMESPSQVEFLDLHRFRVRAPDGARYLAGVAGLAMIKAMGLSKMPAAGVPIRVPKGRFTVTPLQVDERGMKEIEFQFDEPLDSPNMHFYLGSPQFVAYPMQLPKRLAQTRPA